MHHDEEILDKIYRRGSQLRRRRRIAQTLSSTLVMSLVGGGMVFALSGSPKPSEEALPAHEPTVSKTETTKPKPSESPKPKPPAESPKPKPTATTKESVKPAPKPTTEPNPECVNSLDPACGEFSWKTKPYNSWIDAGVSGPTSLTVGQQGSWTLSASDSDAKIVWWAAIWGDGSITTPGDKPGCVKGYGPWSLPSKTSSSLSKTMTHTFETPGTYLVKFKVMSKDNRLVDGKYLCQQAYGDGRYVELTVTVTEPAPPEPDPTPTTSTPPKPTF